MNTTTLQQIPQRLNGVNRPIYGIIALWALSMICLPIFRWTIGDEAIVWGVYITTCLQAFAAVTTLASSWRPLRVLYTIGIVVFATLAAEAIGTATGLPFGRYHYTDILHPQILDVPIIITIAWLMMLPSAWAVGYLLSGKTFGWRFILLSAAAMTAWDLFLDPQMVNWNLWQWENTDGLTYFGIPWINYGGWLLTSGIVTLLVHPRNLPIPPLLLIYGIVWMLQTIGMLFFWGMLGPALVGFIVMGTFTLLAIRQYYIGSEL